MRPRAYVTDISLTGVPARAPSVLLDTIRVGPNTYMGVNRACDEAMDAPSSVSRAVLDPLLRGVTFLATEGLDEIRANKANQQCHFKTYSRRDLLRLRDCLLRAILNPLKLCHHRRRIQARRHAGDKGFFRLVFRVTKIRGLLHQVRILLRRVRDRHRHGARAVDYLASPAA